MYPRNPLQVGIGHCAKDAWGDSMTKAENAWRSAWDYTAEAISAAGQVMVEDFREVEL